MLVGFNCFAQGCTCMNSINCSNNTGFYAVDFHLNPLFVLKDFSADFNDADKKIAS